MFTGNATTILGLPQYNPNDRPDFLTDINTAFKKIDENALDVDTELTSMQTDIENIRRMLQQLRIDCGLTSAEREV